ncbi:MAG: urease accessory protein UreD [Betaproteobacteria bacterium]|nr:urease accessory protein UreD [Betaproteobacteria bacterium]
MFDGRTAAWHAALALRVRSAGGRAVLASEHRGPLRVQKALYPEGASTAHVVVLHPPGGIAGGDALDIAVEVLPGAHALVTTPGAAKWYKANGRTASQNVRLDARGTLEWLPQEAIVYDGAEVHSCIDIRLDRGAAMIGWDIVALGRHAAGESFSQGLFSQSIRLRVDDELLWVERTRIRGGDALLQSPVGLSGNHVFGSLWAAGPGLDDAAIESLRTALGGTALLAPPTRLAPNLLVARTLGGSTQSVRAVLTDVWAALRPGVCGRDAALPRIWAT